MTVAFDPLLAKVIAHAPTRHEAAASLALALERLHLGGVTTNRDFLAATLRHPAFLAGDTTTDFISRHAPPLSLSLTDDELWRAAVAAALWVQARNRARAPVLGAVPSGWRNARLPAQSVSLRHRERVLAIDYRSRRDGSFEVGGAGVAIVHGASDRDIDLELDGRRARSRVTLDADDIHVQCPRGTVSFALQPRFVVPGTEVIHGGLVAPMPGVVIEVRVGAHQVVEPGETLVVLEAMKMEHVITAPGAGRVSEVFVKVGQQVSSGTTLLSIDEVALMAAPIRIANCSGFYGDRISAAREMVDGGPIDVLTGDWLAELTMLILARTRLRQPGVGYARSFLTQMEQVLGTVPRPWHQGRLQRRRPRAASLRRGRGRDRRAPGRRGARRLRQRRRPAAAPGGAHGCGRRLRPPRVGRPRGRRVALRHRPTPTWGASASSRPSRAAPTSS